MSLLVEVKSAVATEISGVSKAGKPYNIRKQVAWAHTYDDQGKLNPYPERIEMNLANGQDPYPVGRYTLSDSCFYVGDFNQLSIGRLVLDQLISRTSSAA